MGCWADAGGELVPVLLVQPRDLDSQERCLVHGATVCRNARYLSKEVLDGARDDAPRLISFAKHSVRLATARLAVSETARVVALEHEVHLLARHRVEYGRLLRVRPGRIESGWSRQPAAGGGGSWRQHLHRHGGGGGSSGSGSGSGAGSSNGSGVAGDSGGGSRFAHQKTWSKLNACSP